MIVAGFFLMILAPCAFAIFTSRDDKREDTKNSRARLKSRSTSSGSRFLAPVPRTFATGWRATLPARADEYDLVLTGDPTFTRAAVADPASFVLPSDSPRVYITPPVQRSRGASNLLSAAADAEADSIAAQVYAAQANKAALAAAARAASARAAAATALAVEAERAVAEATRLAAAVRRAYETAPASVGPEKHALPETHPSMDFPRSHVIHRAA
jgi:hypothetical protein